MNPGCFGHCRCISPDLKSLALGIQTLATRTLGKLVFLLVPKVTFLTILMLQQNSSYIVLSLGGIPAPVYFGALIDSTCLKWSIKKCGGRGACRIYDSAMYRCAKYN